MNEDLSAEEWKRRYEREREELQKLRAQVTRARELVTRAVHR